MTDRLTIMSWLEGLAQDDWRECHSDSEVQEIARQTLALLKEQEAVEPIVDSFLNRRCPKCNAVLKGKFCFECGQAVRWNDY